MAFSPQVGLAPQTSMAIPALVRYDWCYNDPKRLQRYIRWALVALALGMTLTVVGWTRRLTPLLAIVGLPLLLGASILVPLLAFIGRRETGWGGLWVRQVPSPSEEASERLETALSRAGIPCKRGFERPTRAWLRKAVTMCELPGLARIWVLHGLPRMYGAPQRWERAVSTLVIEPSERAGSSHLDSVKRAVDDAWASAPNPREALV